MVSFPFGQRRLALGAPLFGQVELAAVTGVDTGPLDPVTHSLM